MKLIGPQKNQVQSLGRHQSGLTAEAGKAQAIQTVTQGVSSALGTVAGAAEDILMTNSKRQNEKRQLMNQKEDNDFWEEWGGRDFFDVDELPSDIVTEGMEIGGRIASAEVLPMMYEDHMREVMKRTAKIIENPKARGDYTTSDMEIFEGRMQGIRKQAENQISRQNLLDQNINRKNAIENKRPDVARQITDQMDISPAERKFNHMEEDIESEILTYEDLLLESEEKIPEILDAIEYLSRENLEYRDDNGNFDATTQLMWRNRLLSEIGRLARQEESGAAADIALLKNKIRVAKENNLSGDLNSTDDLTRLMHEIDTNPDSDKMKVEKLELQKAIVFNDHAVNMAMLDDEGRAAYLNKQRDLIGDSPHDRQFIRRLEKYDARVANKISTDMVQHSIDSGFIKNPVFIDIEGGSAYEMAQQLNDAKGQHDVLFQNFGHSQGIMTKQQAASLSTRYNKMDVDDQMAFLGATSAVMGRDAAVVFDQLRADGSSNSQSIAGEAFISGDKMGANHILNGNAARRARPEEVRELVSDLGFDFQSKVGTAFSGNNPHYAALKDAYADAYLGLAQARGYDFENIKTESFFGLFGEDLDAQAFEIATGGIVTHSDSNLSPPIRNMGQEEFDDWIENIPASYIDESGGVKNISSAELLNRINEGDYVLRDTFKIGEYYIWDDHKQRFIQDKNDIIFTLKYQNNEI